MKRIVLALTAVAITFSAMAQGKSGKSKDWKQDKIENKSDNKESNEEKKDWKEGHGKGMGKGHNKMEELNLTAEQKTQMKSINETFKSQMQEINHNAALSAADKKEKRTAILNERKEKIAALLNNEQKQKFQEIKKENQEDRKEAHAEGRGHDGAGRLNKMQEMSKDLNLTPDQSAKMKSINTNFRDKVKEIQGSTSLNQEQKREEMKSLSQKHRSDIESVLTEEQKKQMKEKMQSMREKRN